MAHTEANANPRNYILSSLDGDEYARLGPHLTRTSNELGEPLLRPGDPIDRLYFPETAMASAMGITSEGATAEVGVMGWEGLVGLPRLFGAETQPNIVSFQMPGDGMLLLADIAVEEFARGGNFQRAVLRYANHLMVQMGRTGVCNAVHGVEKRLSKWLLMCHDRSPGDRLRLTQEFLATMVAVSRQSVSGAAHVLQDRGVIRYSRGIIEVLDRTGLESSACDCYGLVALRPPQADN